MAISTTCQIISFDSGIMTDYHPRDIGDAVSAALENMPVVVVTGMRQTGKTTFLCSQLGPGERSLNLKRAINNILGVSRKDDRQRRNDVVKKQVLHPHASAPKSALKQCQGGCHELYQLPSVDVGISATTHFVHYRGDHKTILGFFGSSLASSISFPYVMQLAMQCLTQAGSRPFLVLFLHKTHNSVGNGRKVR